MSRFTAEMRAAARHLVAARVSRHAGERLPEACRPADVADALAIQERVRELLGAAIGGWKCSVPSAAREIAAAPIFASTITSNSPCTILPIEGKARIRYSSTIQKDRERMTNDWTVMMILEADPCPAVDPVVTFETNLEHPRIYLNQPLI